MIQKKQGMPSAKKKMEEIFNNVEVVNKNKRILYIEKPKRLISKLYSDIVIKCKNLCSISVYFYAKRVR